MANQLRLPRTVLWIEFVSAVIVAFFAHGASASSGSKLSPQSRMDGVVEVSWQLVKSRMPSALAGTMTETYAAKWTTTIMAQHLTIESRFAKFETPWLALSANERTGELTITRNELVHLLGIEREFPPEWVVAEDVSPLRISIHGSQMRTMDTVLRFADDNMVILIRLNARAVGS